MRHLLTRSETCSGLIASGCVTDGWLVEGREGRDFRNGRYGLGYECLGHQFLLELLHACRQSGVQAIEYIRRLL
jgi:hypothetical protein